MPPQTQHLLLIGAPRSGTTLLASMIGRHPDVGMLNEDVTGMWLTKVLGKPWTGNKLCVPNQIQLRPRGLLARRIFKRLGIVREAPRSALCLLDYLARPEVRVIAIVRDGHATVASMRARGGNRFVKAARRWAAAIEAIHILTTDYPERVLVVPFDDVVLLPEPTMRRVCTFLGLPFEPRMLDGHRFNPYYPRDTLEAAAVQRAVSRDVERRLEQAVPIACEHYRYLIAKGQSA